ncbi:hypothetical protein vseg_003628 [Gypsophila vaccaria]
MANNKMQGNSFTNDASSSDDSDDEMSNRDDERGRTILSKVGMTIQNGTKIPLDWHAVRKTPCGKNRLSFSSYIGVVVRERVCITYINWKVVPKTLLDELYESIAKGFTVRADRKKWILSRACDLWRGFKTRLRKRWLYKKSGKLRKRPPWKYPWIIQPVWDKFKELCTTEKFKEISVDSKKRSNFKDSSYRGGRLGYQYYEDEIVQEHLNHGRHIDQVPRHELWIRAHSRVKNGKQTFNNPNDYEIAKEINALTTMAERGEIVLEGGRDDILARALKKPEHGGCVRGIGSGITNTEYFEFCRPTPPSQMRAELTSLRSEMAVMRNNHQFMMTFMMSCLDQDQMKQFMAGVSQVGTFVGQGSGQGGSHFSRLNVHTNDQQDDPNDRHGAFSGLQGNANGNIVVPFDAMTHNDDGQVGARGGDKIGFFTQLLNSGDDGFSQWSKGNDGFSQCSKSMLNPSNFTKFRPQYHEKELDQPCVNDKAVGTEYQTDVHYSSEQDEL